MGGILDILILILRQIEICFYFQMFLEQFSDLNNWIYD